MEISWKGFAGWVLADAGAGRKAFRMDVASAHGDGTAAATTVGQRLSAGQAPDGHARHAGPALRAERDPDVLAFRPGRGRADCQQADSGAAVPRPDDQDGHSGERGDAARAGAVWRAGGV